MGEGERRTTEKGMWVRSSALGLRFGLICTALVAFMRRHSFATIVMSHRATQASDLGDLIEADEGIHLMAKLGGEIAAEALAHAAGDDELLAGAGVGVPVVEEDIGDGIGVGEAGDQVGRGAGEGDIAAVGADRGIVAVARCGRGDARAVGGEIRRREIRR